MSAHNPLMPGGKILVVDDLPANLMVARGLLAPYGLQVDTAVSGHEAIELVKGHDYDIILMDHMMPEMDGVEAAAVIKNDLRQPMPIIALTGNDLQGMREFYLEHGFEDYLSKPLSPQSLNEALVKWIPGIKSVEQRNANIAVEMESQRLDMLNHYRVSFESGREVDAAYFERFTTLVESLDTANMAGEVREQAALLIEAGRRKEAHTIRGMLPAFCESVRKQQSEGEMTGDKPLGAILPRLKKAILAEETETAEAIMGEMGALSLTPSGRELYFLLYDLLLTGETQKAAGAINLWEKLSQIR